MRQVTVPEAEAMFGALVSQVEHGETIAIVEDGRVVARLVAPLPMPKKPLDIEGLRVHIATMPMHGRIRRRLRQQDARRRPLLMFCLDTLVLVSLHARDAARAFGTQVASILSVS